MPETLSAFDHDRWDRLGLADYSEFSDRTTDCNQEDLGDCSQGEWYYIPDEPLANGDKVIYNGTWGNYNSPGASSYTYATIYSPDEEEQFQAAKREWENTEEWLEVEEPEEDEYPDFDSMDAEGLKEHLEMLGASWSEITETDPESNDSASESELEIVRNYLKGNWD